MVNVEELFTNLAKSLLGDDIVDVLEVLLRKGTEMTDEEIANTLNIKVNDVRKKLNLLEEQGFVSYRKTRDKDSGWYIYYWKPNIEQINEILLSRKRLILDKLRIRLEYERNNTFFICPQDNARYSFEEAFENEFKCPKCGSQLSYYDSDKIKTFLEQKIRQIEEEIEKETKLGANKSS
ncbi:transcription factor [Sulfolobus sp. A20]|uniref:transcription factor n=1 Tax=Saccharolobus sp. A20 TaxID=1891280 RepID=UPI00084624D3|nr:transcription factor [Sulfolobus sp. A20]TRM76551.1 transcription factor [Sulfolobus sp. B5]TRM77767.1 transcription factor [Sulfolobus sp. A20-N-F8]TRM81428.1 transcription factor [Sulfolobus sp. D5]TRM83922.1 transcription factor [Sulfolobus sp. A20-N-F6]TRM88719.1 transcription factor [Sulfolobus sp. C3]TRM97440.1 transcription factor [Sulfolobus sp. F1]